MDIIEKALPNYTISSPHPNTVFVVYYGRFISCRIDWLLKDIEIIKFIHDNILHIINLILINEYVEESPICFVKDNLLIFIHHNYLYLNDHSGHSKSLSNPNTLMDELLEFLGIDITYKPVIMKNE